MRTLLLVTATVVMSVVLVPSEARVKAIAKPSAPSSAGSIFTPDKGKFRITVSGQPVGQEEFQIERSGGDWVAHGTAQVQTPQGTSHVTGTLNIRPDGLPQRYEWSTEGAKKASASVVFQGVTANIALHLAGAQPYTQQFTFSSPRVVVLDNNLYHQYSILARLYDWEKKGVQSFAVLVPQEMTPGMVTVESLGKQTSGGTQLDELRVKTEDNEIDLFLDGPKLMRVLAPSANAEIVRE